MANFRTEELIKKQLSGTISAAEQQELAELLPSLSNEELDSIIFSFWEAPTEKRGISAEKSKIILNSILKTERAQWPRLLSIAASVILLLCLGGYYYLVQIKKGKTSPQLAVYQDIAPGANRATLTLSNGKKIILGHSGNSILSSHGNVVINQDSTGTISLKYKSDFTAVDLKYDTLTTPVGGIYNIILGDGTRVWLNAASAIRFPEKFAASGREIELIRGEAYFEVVHSAGAPFSVKTPGTLVEDIGTHFNINAYNAGNREKTTLLEGSISIKTNRQYLVVKPGELAEINRNTQLIRVAKVDIENIVAWKDGLFMFSKERLEDVMQDIARWYNVQIRYESPELKNQILTGSISKFKNVSEILSLLEATGNVHFELNNKLITIHATNH